MLEIEKIAEKMKNVGMVKGLSAENHNGQIDEQCTIYVKGEFANDYLMVCVLSEMLKNGELLLAYTKKTTDENKKYLEKLLKEN